MPHDALNHLKNADLLEHVDLQPEGRPEGDKRTGRCPEGHGILRRARVSWEAAYFLERCGSCGGVWFDAGEWTRTASEGLLDRCTDLWGPAWREWITEERVKRSLEEDLRKRLGDELFEKVDVLGRELSDHEHRATALAYLQRRLKD